MLIEASKLEHDRLSSVYQERLAFCWKEFRAWVVMQALTLAQVFSSFSVLDDHLCDYINQCHVAQMKVWRVRHTILACQSYFPECKGKLPRAWNCIRGWQRQLVWDNRLPISEVLVKFMFAVSLSWALEAPSLARFLIPFAVLIRVGFYSLLRPGELTSLLRNDIHFSDGGAAESGRPVAMAIRDPKTWGYMGRSQFALLHDAASIEWLRWLCQDLAPGLKLWPSTLTRFRDIFRQVLSRGKIEINLTPASLRAGGATHLVLAGWELSRLMFFGRWKTSSTLVSYIQEAMSALIWANLSDTQHILVRSLVAQSVSFWTSPPTVPWPALFNRNRQRKSQLRSGKKQVRFWELPHRHPSKTLQWEKPWERIKRLPRDGPGSIQRPRRDESPNATPRHC